MTNTKLIYAGIGSRKISDETYQTLQLIGCCMTLVGYRLNTGGAKGSDSAFESGAIVAHRLLQQYESSPLTLADLMHCYLPWPGFNNRPRNHPAYIFGNFKKAEQISRTHHPAWDNLTPVIRSLMNRNACQVLGTDLNEPVKMVITYTPDGVVSGDKTTQHTGGTGQAIRLASTYGIQVFNIQRVEHLDRLMTWTDKIRMEWQKKHGIDIILILQAASLSRYT